MSLSNIASKVDIPSVNTLHKWVKLYTDSGYNDDIFNSKKGKPQSIISDIYKVPPFIYESAGITKDSSNNFNDSSVLMKKLEYYERLLLEKELLLKCKKMRLTF